MYTANSHAKHFIAQATQRIVCFQRILCILICLYSDNCLIWKLL